MTVLKEPTAARPSSSQHRTSLSSAASSLPSKSRVHSHSLSVGSINPAHRVTRRKSMTSTNVAVSAITKGVGGASLEPGMPSQRRTSKAGLGPRGPSLTNHAAMPSSLPSNGSIFSPSGGYNAALAKTNEMAVADGPTLASMPEIEKGTKGRIRRASEGSHLKSNSKKLSGGELRCERCGKGYKHSSCLTKHLWEHTPEWQLTSKLLISKHQQVQLLEAASVLINMNQDGESSKDSDHSSASPAASGSSDLREDDLSSTDTTPPPQPEEVAGSYSNFGRSNRLSTNSSAYSRSYQSTSVFSDGSQNHSSHYRQWSNDGRPTTSGTSVAGSYYDEDEQADLAAAVGLLSCSYGTPKSVPVSLGHDVPPVPPLPARFLDMKSESMSGSTTTVTANQSSIRGTSFLPHAHDAKDVDMDHESFDDDFEPSAAHHHRMDDDDDGVFGTMEY